MKKRFLLGLFLAVALLPFSPQTGNAASSSGDVNLEESLRKILKNNPNIILDVLRQNSEAVLDIAQQGSNLRRKHNLESQWREDMKKPKEIRVAGRPVLGNPNARVKIVAFSDFTCHYCAQASKNVDGLLKDYGENVAFIFKHLPLDEKGPGGIASAYFVAIALQDEKKSWDFYRKMYENRDSLLAEGEPFIKKTAQQLGVDMKKLQKDMQSKKVKDILAQDMEDGQKLGVEGTPYFLVNDLVVRGALPMELFKNAVDMALENTK